MSQVQKSVTLMLQDVEYHIRRTRYMFGSQLLSEKNNTYVCDLYTVMMCIWHDVSLTPALINTRWVAALASKPVDVIVALLKDIDDWLIRQEVDTYAAFKQRLGECENYKDVGQFLAPLRQNIEAFICSGEGLPRLRTALLFIRRANFPEPLGLEDEAFLDWKETNLAPWEAVDVRLEANALARLFPRSKGIAQLSGFVGRFGPGCSADVKGKALVDKYKAWKIDPSLEYLDKILEFDCRCAPCKPGKLARLSRLSFAPKYLEKLRTISEEPATLMYYQLGIAQLIIDRIAHSPWAKHINLEKDYLNQDLAWLGSIGGGYSTIDLSKASDSVKYSLVKELFNQTSLREAIRLTRSRHVEYKGQIYQPEYFAPMGSGLCFPIECLVFASVVDTVMHRHSDRRAWRVYGDDIIVPDDRYDEVTDRLSQLGFCINHDKSFTGGGGFRESCGGDYFWGEDVRPIYVSRFWPGLHPIGGRMSAAAIESNIDLANRLFDYKAARLRVIAPLLKDRRIGPIFTYDGEAGLYSATATNYHLQSRWSEDNQSKEFKAGMSMTKPAKAKQEHEGIRYFETLRAMAYDPLCSDRRPISVERTCRPEWKKRWRSPAPGWPRE